MYLTSKKISLFIILYLVFNCANCVYSQYYTNGQIQLISNNKNAYEGDIYLDTINNKYYVGLTNGELAKIGDTLDELIDSVKLINDSINIFQNDTIFKVPISGVSEKRDNYKLVKNITDLAEELTAGGGSKYLLDSNYLYEINGTIIFNHPIEINNAYITGEDGFEDILFNASGGELFNGSTGGYIKRVVVVGNNFPIFNITASGSQNLISQSVNYTGASSLGNLSNFNLVFFHIAQLINNTNGLTATNINSLFMTLFTWDLTNSGTFLTLLGTFDELQLANGRITADATETGIDVSSNPFITTGASITQVDFSGAGNRINGYTAGTYPNYNFSNHWDIESQGIVHETDGDATGNFYISTPALTNIPAVNTPVKAAGTTTSLYLFRTADSSTNNKLTYIGTQTRNFTYSAAMTVTSPVNNDIYNFYIAKNGVVLPESRQGRKIATGADKGSITLSGVIRMQTGDYLEVWVENISTGNDITVETLNFLMR